jgi:hypothetical protein
LELHLIHLMWYVSPLFVMISLWLRLIICRQRQNSTQKQETPIHPPGLVPPSQEERLWRPHEDKYWQNLREMWGSTLDLHEADNHASGHADKSNNNRSIEDHHQDRDDDDDGMHDVDINPRDDLDLTTAGGTVFRIVLADGQNQPTVSVLERDNTDVAPPAGGSHLLSHSNANTERSATNWNHRNSTPLNDALALHLPPYVFLPKPTLARFPRSVPPHTHNTLTHALSVLFRPAVPKSKGRRNFNGSVLNVSVTTTTRTYGDFSKSNPPPYTPRPTGAERSFGRSGRFMDSQEEKKAKWPVAKWLFVLGFRKYYFITSSFSSLTRF